MKNTLLYAALLSLGIYSTIGTSFAQIVSENGGSSYSYNTGSYYGYNDNRSDTSIDFDATGQTGDNVYATGSSSWSYNYGHTGSSNYGWGTHTFTNPGNLSSQTGYATGYGYGTQQSNAVDTTFLQYGTGSSYYHQLSVNESYFETNYGYGSSWYHFDGFGVKYGFGSSRYNGSSTGYSSGYSSWSYGNGTSSGYSESLYQSNSSNVNNGSNSWWYNNCGYGYGSAWRNVSQYGGASSYNYNGNGTSFDSPLTSNEFGFATSQSFPYVDCGYGMGTNYGGGTSSGSTGQVYTGWSGQTFTGRVQGVCDYFNQQFELTQWSLYESLLDYFNCNVGNQPIMIIQDPYICGSSLKGKITSSDPLNYQNVQLHLYSGSTLTYSFAPVISSDGAFEQLIDYDNATASNYVIPGVYTYEYIGSDYRGVASGSYQVNIQKNCTPSGGSYSGPVGSPTPSGSGLQTTGIVSELINRVELSVEEKLLESVNTIQEIVHLIDSVQPFSSLIKKSHPAASLLPSTGVNE